MKPVLILITGDPNKERSLIEQAFQEVAPERRLVVVQNTDELENYLRHSGGYTDLESSPRPGLVILDIDFGKNDAQQMLHTIKSDPELRRLPVLVLSDTETEEHIYRSYDEGVNAFVMRPADLEDWKRLVRGLDAFWFRVARLPD